MGEGGGNRGMWKGEETEGYSQDEKTEVSTEASRSISDTSVSPSTPTCPADTDALSSVEAPDRPLHLHQPLISDRPQNPSAGPSQYPRDLPSQPSIEVQQERKRKKEKLTRNPTAPPLRLRFRSRGRGRRLRGWFRSGARAAGGGAAAGARAGAGRGAGDADAAAARRLRFWRHEGLVRRRGAGGEIWVGRRAVRLRDGKVERVVGERGAVGGGGMDVIVRRVRTRDDGGGARFC